MNDLCFLWLQTWYRLDLGVDSNIFGVKEVKKTKINFLTLTVDLENQGHIYVPVSPLLPLAGNVIHRYKLDLGVDSRIFEVMDIKKAKMNFMNLTFDLENQGQTYTYVTSIISGWIHATDLILLLISTFTRSRISNKPKQIT